MTPSAYWKNNTALSHITPPGDASPEVGLMPVLSKVCRGTVFEFGCGYGRLAPVFRPDIYTGMDINQHAIAEAKARNPAHVFVSDWVRADTVLAHTVLLHVPDDEIESIIGRMREYRRIVIGEIMGRKWRRSGNPPVFNREAEEYTEMVGRSPEVIRVAYPRYKTDLHILVF